MGLRHVDAAKRAIESVIQLSQIVLMQRGLECRNQYTNLEQCVDELVPIEFVIQIHGS